MEDADAEQVAMDRESRRSPRRLCGTGTDSDCDSILEQRAGARDRPVSRYLLIILSGPSYVGKSPLAKALGRFHPDLSAKLQPIVLYNSRSPRPGERDAEDDHFRSRGQIAALGERKNFVVMDVRGDLQALDLEDLSALLSRGDAFFEGNPFIGRTLQTHPSACARFQRSCSRLVPLTRQSRRISTWPERDWFTPR